jgi:hypothetical protein
MNVHGIRLQHRAHHGVASMRGNRIGRHRWQAIDQPHAQMIAGIELQSDAAVGRKCARAWRALVMLRHSRPAHFEDPRDRMTIAEGDGGRFSNDEKVQPVVGTGKFGRLSWSWLGRSRIS